MEIPFCLVQLSLRLEYIIEVVLSPKYSVNENRGFHISQLIGFTFNFTVFVNSFARCGQ
jgi:hypothetical protein